MKHSFSGSVSAIAWSNGVLISEEEDKLNDKLVKVVPVLSVMQVTGDIYVTGRDTGYELTIKV